jgi:hypothetical protein
MKMARSAEVALIKVDTSIVATSGIWVARVELELSSIG